MDALAGRFHYLVGRVLAFWGWNAGAAQAFEDALRRSPLADAHFRRGESLARLQRWSEAAASYSAAARLRPSDAEVQGNLVVAHGRSGHWRDAEAAVRRL